VELICGTSETHQEKIEDVKSPKNSKKYQKKNQQKQLQKTSTDLPEVK